jgi:predicted GTPase
MQRWRIITLAALVATPILVLLGLGAYYLWWSGWGFWTWWPMSGCFALAYFLAWRWQKERKLLTSEPPPPMHWTDRDREAWKLVETFAEKASKLPAEQMLSLPKCVETAQDLALELARFYHPNASDPVGSLTVPEILSVVELAARDLYEMVDEYLPGGHLLTINDVRRFKKVADWYPVASNVYWLIAGVFNPVSTAAKYFASQGGVSLPWRMLQDNLLVWFFTAYLHRLGNYLIEVNSGRLRVGAERYRALKKENERASVNGFHQEGDGTTVPVVAFVLVGQAKAGKSSLINALLGDQQALADVVPATAEITRYELKPEGVTSRFQLLDTVGYGNSGPKGDQLRATENAAHHADMILLVLHARNPARQADVDMLKSLDAFYKARPELRRPPILAVLTHIDLLSPALEWSPPYDWEEPKRLKEQQIHEAVTAVREQLGEFLDGVIPVCTAEGKVYGIQEWLLPTLVGLLDQAHAVAFLHCLKAEADTGKVRKVFGQLLSAAKGLGGILIQGRASSKR